MSGDVYPKCISVWLFAVEPLSFSREIQLGIRSTPWKTQIISLPVKFPAHRSKFQFCTTAKYNKLNCRVFVFIFLNPAAELMLNMLFNTLFKITPHNTQKRRRKKKEQSSNIQDDIRRGLPIQLLPRLTGLNLSGAT